MSDSAKITVNYFCLGALLIFIGSILLCTLGFTVVLPFEVTRGWPAVPCTVVNSSYDSNVCSCDEQLNVFDTCVSKYPCLQIHVIYFPKVRDLHRVDRKSNYNARHLLPTINRTLSPELESSANPNTNETGINSVGYERVRRSRQRNGVELNVSHVSPEISVNLTKTKHGDNPTGSRFRDTLIDTGSSTTADVDDDDELNSNDSVSSVLFEDDEVDDLKRGTELKATTTKTTMITNVIVGESDYDYDDVLPPPSTIVTSSGKNFTNVDEPLPAEEKRNRTLSEEIGVFAKLYRSWDDSFQHQCSLTECGDETWNVKEARRFKADWGRLGQTFTCFYNPLRPDMVIIERTTTAAAIHAIIWPGLCLIGGITLWLGLCIGCWSLGSESSCKDDYGPIY